MRWSTVLVCVAATLLVNLVEAVPQALVHIGPHKAASSYIQSSFHRIWKYLAASNFYWPTDVDDTLLGPKDISMYWAALIGEAGLKWFTGTEMTPELEIQKMVKFIQHSLHLNRNIILSTEAFSLMEPEHISLLKQHLKGFNTTIVFVYRDVLSQLISLHFEDNRFERLNFNFSVSFSTYALSHFDNLPLTLQPMKMLDSFASVFGQQHLRVIDLAGTVAAGRDVAHVMACDTMGILCDHADLFQQNDTHRNPSYSLIPVQVFSFYKVYVTQHKRSFCGSIVQEYYHFEKRYNNYTRAHNPPANLTTQLVPLRPFVNQIDRELRAKYGAQFILPNQTAALESSRRAKVAELHLEQFLQDLVWHEWIKEEFKLAQMMGRICHTSAHNHTTSK